MSVVGFLESESAPLASHGGVLVSLVQLDVLHGMAEAELVNASASSHVSVHLNDGKLVDQFLGIRSMGHRRDLSTSSGSAIIVSNYRVTYLELIRFPILVIKSVLGVTERSESELGNSCCLHESD